MAKREERGKMVLTIIFTVICIAYIMPILIVLINSFKSNAAVNTETFAFPDANSFVGFQNYIKGMTFGNYPFLKAVGYSLFITLASTALILVCTSMAAWYVSRVGSFFSKIVYYLCVFSMVVPFQMVMFTLSRTANQLSLDTPWTIPVIYLGFGAGLAVFMFCGFMRSVPVEIEEAAMIDGCNPLQTFFRIVFPILPGGTPHDEADDDLRRRAGDHVGVERLPSAVSRARPHGVYDHPHRHTASQGKLRTGGHGCDDGTDPSEHPAGHHLLSLLPETHY